MNPKQNSSRWSPKSDSDEGNYYEQLKETFEFDKQFEKDLLPEGYYPMIPLCLEKALENVIAEGEKHFNEYNSNGYSKDVLMSARLSQIFPPKKETSYAQVVSGNSDRSAGTQLESVVPNISQLFGARTLDEVRRYQLRQGYRSISIRSSTPESSSSGAGSQSIRAIPCPQDAAKSSSNDQSDPELVCFFCLKNNDSKYNTHRLKDRSGAITCPILRRYTCPLCGATGNDAHTKGHCPLKNKTKTNVCTLKKNSYGKIKSMEPDKE